MRHAGGEIHPHPHEPDHEHFHEREDGGEREGPEHGGDEAREPSFPRSAAFPTLHDVGRDAVQRRAVHRVLPRRARTRAGFFSRPDVRSIAAATRASPSSASKRKSAPLDLARVDLIVKPLRVLKQRWGAPQCAASYGTFPNVSNALADATQSVALYTRASSARGRIPVSTTTRGGSCHDSATRRIGPSPTMASVVPAGRQLFSR